MYLKVCLWADLFFLYCNLVPNWRLLFHGQKVLWPVGGQAKERMR